MDTTIDINATEYSPSVMKYIENAFSRTMNQNDYFTISDATSTALDILPKQKSGSMIDSGLSSNISSRSNTTVFSVLNRCRTKQGQGLLAFWLKHPLKARKDIDSRLEIVSHLLENVTLRSLCYEDYLRKIPDLVRVAYRMSKEKCSLDDLMKVYNSCKQIQNLYMGYLQLIRTINTEAPESVKELFHRAEVSCKDLGDFMKLIDDSIDVNSIDESGDYLVKPECDEAIARITLEINNYCSSARKQLKLVADDIHLEANRTLKLETDSEKGFAFKVTKQNEQAVRGNSDYEQLSLVKKDGYRFTNRALTKLSDKYVSAKDEYAVSSKNIVEEIISKAVMYDDQVLDLAMIVTLIDVFVGLATAASQNNYCLPLILDSDAGKIVLEKVRHPCIENQPDIDNYVANDLSMSDHGKKFYVITGPNMGGKSTFIKSIAITVIMAQCGSLVPADEAKISIVDGVYTRVGAGDKQMDGISTFMEEMMDMSVIMKEATQYSLVIIDELGRGTSTFDGFGLAWSISHHLAANIKSYVLFATHFIELTELEKEIDTVGNLHVKAICQDERLIMLFNIDSGVCDDSYGINVARYTKFPDRVIKMAQEKLKQFEEVPGFSSKQEVREFVNNCVGQYSGAGASN